MRQHAQRWARSEWKVVAATPEQFGQRIKADAVKLGGVTRPAGIKLD